MMGRISIILEKVRLRSSSIVVTLGRDKIRLGLGVCMAFDVVCHRRINAAAECSSPPSPSSFSATSSPP